MKSLTLVFCFLVSALSCFSQPAETQNIIVNPFWDFFAENRLAAVNAGKGYTGVASMNDINGVSLNPASLVLLEKFQVSGSYEIKSRVKWLPTITDDMYVKQVHPEMSVGIGWKAGDNLFTGISYRNDNSFKLDYGEIIRTNEFGQIIGSYQGFEKYTTHTISVPIAYRTKRFRAGVELAAVNYKGLNNFPYQNQAGEGDNNISFWKFIPTLGVIVMPFEQFSFGVTYSPPYQENVKWDNANDPVAPVYFPAKVNVGTEFRFLQNKLLFNLDYRFANTSRSYMLKDRHDFNFGVQYQLEPEFAVRAGFFTLLDYRTNDKGANFIDPIGSYDQYFLTFGATYKYKALGVSLAYMSSTIITKPDVSTSRVAASITWDICSCLLYGR
ncbi:MAG: OmpP1/FadL family transporter [Ignavibacteria bacterium]